MKAYKKDQYECGIYCILNHVNGKMYVGKSSNIFERIKQHITQLNIKSKDENRHLIRSWHKYGRNKFSYFVLEYVSENDNILKERELYWQITLMVTNREYGYNLRLDSSTGCIVSEETKQRLSDSRKLRPERFPELDKEVGLKTSKFWKNNPDIKKQMSKKISDIITVYKIYQYTKDRNTLIKIWEKVKDIIKENPNYKVHNIYAVCSGEKPSMYGYFWKKIKK